jgi:hypothetical protein
MDQLAVGTPVLYQDTPGLIIDMENSRELRDKIYRVRYDTPLPSKDAAGNTIFIASLWCSASMLKIDTARIRDLRIKEVI